MKFDPEELARVPVDDLLRALGKSLLGDEMAKLEREREDAAAMVQHARIDLDRAQRREALARAELYQLKHGELAPTCKACAKRIEDDERKIDEMG